MKKRIMSLVLAAMMLVGTLISGSITQAAENSPYNDVPADHWALDDIKFATDEGLMKGTGTKIFEPETVMNRAMVVTVLYRYAGSPAVGGENKFTDVSEGAWYETPVIWASANGIVFGITENRFDPLSEIKREQLTAIIMRYAKKQAHVDTTKTENIENFEDYETIEEYAREPMAWAKANGILNGLTTTTMGPKGGATRAQFAAIIHRYDNAFGFTYNKPVYGQNYVEPEYERVEDADIYVSTTGDDNATGKKDDPIASFEEARDRVRELKKTKIGDIKVAFFAGEYTDLENLEFDNALDSGNSEQYITYCAYGDGDVVFSNGVQIPNSEFEAITSEEAEMFPEEARENIYKVDLSAKNIVLTPKTVLFSGKGVCDQARYPNKTDDMHEFRNMTTRVEEEGKTPKEYDKLLMQYSLARKVDAFTTYEGLEITGYLRTGWFQDTFPIKSYDRDTNYLTIDFENWNLDGSAYQLGDEEYPLAYEGRMTDTIYFHNLAEFLDHDGEYWFDTKTNTLYVYNPIGDYVIPTGGKFMGIGYGTSHLNFVGLEFNGTLESAIESSGWNLTFDRCTIANVAGGACISAECSTDFVISNSEFYNFVRGGVQLTPYYWHDSRTFKLKPTNNRIVNNYFHDFGLPQYFDNADAVGITYDVGCYIANNEFVNGSHGAIRYDSCIDMIIEYNVFDNLMMNTQDFGAIYTYASEIFRGNQIRYNLFTSMLENEAKHSIYFDGAFGGTVYGNLFYNTGDVFYNEGRDHISHDNIVISSDSKRNFILGIDRLYNYVEDGRVVKDGWESEFEGALSALNYKPKPEDTAYETWLERWPILYKYNLDIDNYGDYECFYTTYNEVKDNKLFGARLFAGSIIEATLDRENNMMFGLSENPYFKDPTNGDYTIVGGFEDFNEEYMFDINKVGRK